MDDARIAVLAYQCLDDKGLNAFACGRMRMSEAYVDDDAEKLAAVLKAAGAVELIHVYSPSGARAPVKILRFSDHTKFRGKLAGAEHWEFKHGEDTFRVFPIKEVQAAKVKQDKPEQALLKNTRRIKTFSGNDPPRSGECKVKEWVELCEDLMDHDSHLSDLAKVQVIRTSLVDEPMTLVAEYHFKTPRELVDLVARTYGGLKSLDQSWAEFWRSSQADRESPSHFWSRLHKMLAKIVKQSTVGVDTERIRFRQFSHGLCMTDHDLISGRSSINLILQEQDKVLHPYPSYGDYLFFLQDFERGRRERYDRVSRDKVRSSLVFQEESEVPSLKTQVVALQAQLDKLSSAAVSAPLALDTGVKEIEVCPLSQARPQAGFGGPSSRPPSSQQQFGKNPDSTQAASSDAGGRPRKKFVYRGPCFNCYEEGHYSRTCPKEVDDSRIDRNIQRYFKDKEVNLKRRMKNSTAPIVGDFEESTN